MVKNLPANAGDSGWAPGLGRSPGEGNGNPPLSLFLLMAMLLLGFSLVALSGGYCCGTRALGLTGFRSCDCRALEHRLSSCARVVAGSVALSMWDLPGPGTKPVSPALAGRFFTTEPPGKP